MDKYPDVSPILLGDYNLPNIKWTSDPLEFAAMDYITPDLRTSVASICDSYSFLNLEQLYPPHPGKGYTLDVLFSPKHLVNHLEIEDDLLPTDSHHISAYFSINKPIKLDEHLTRRRDFHKADYVSINSYLSSVNWDEILSADSIDDNTSSFYNILYHAITNYVPVRKIISHSSPPWFDGELLELISNKKRAHRLYKDSRSQSDYITFKKIRSQCIRLSRIKYKQHISNVESRIGANPKSFWSHISNLSNRNTLPSSTYLGDLQANNDLDIASQFSTCFSSAFTSTHLSFVPPPDSSYNDSLITDFQITPDLVKVAINNSKDSLTSGPDDIPGYFIKRISSSLITPLTSLFNKSLVVGQFPSKFKSAYVQPIFKAGDKATVSNYRPISILNYLAKLLDAIVAQQLSESLYTYIIKEQHGFIKGRSTLTNLLIFTDFVTDALDRSLQVDTVYLDFSKAFDTVRHDLLLRKLWDFGIRGNAHAWIASYLRDRSQSVRVREATAPPTRITSGVPQGSHLGPLLFCIFINDIHSVLRFSKVLIYADDVKLYNVVNSPLDLSNIQRDLEAISVWAVNNGLNLNVSKCNIISFSRRTNITHFDYTLCGQYLNRNTSVKDLGVIIDKKLTFNEHIDHIKSIALRTLGFIKRTTKDFRNVNTLITLYKTLVLPCIYYGCQVWRPYKAYQIASLESIQHRFLRMIAPRLGIHMTAIDHDYSPILNRIELPTINQSFSYYDCLLAYKIAFNYISSTDFDSILVTRSLNYPLRNPRLFQEATSSSSSSFYKPFNRLKRLWNHLPRSLTSLQLGRFKTAIKSHISIHPLT